MGTQIDFGEDEVNKASPKTKQGSRVITSPLKASSIVMRRPSPQKMAGRGSTNQHNIVIKLKGDLSQPSYDKDIKINGEYILGQDTLKHNKNL